MLPITFPRTLAGNECTVRIDVGREYDEVIGDVSYERDFPPAIDVLGSQLLTLSMMMQQKTIFCFLFHEA
jgi:hypothetical protein